MRKARLPRRELQVFEAMLHCGPLPDVVTYIALSSACEKGQQPQWALHPLQAMQVRGLLPEVITYSAANQRV